MASDALTTITNLINSPPGQLVAGSVLAGIVWKFFERVEGILPASNHILNWLSRVGEENDRFPTRRMDLQS